MPKKTIIDEYTSWQKHQFSPGHYTGGNIDPSTRADGNPGRVAIIWFIQAGFLALLCLLAIIQTYRGKAVLDLGNRILSKTEMALLWTAFLGPLASFSFWIGTRYRKKAIQKKQDRKRIANYKAIKKRSSKYSRNRKR